MCGIAGIYNLNQEPVDAGTVKIMTHALRHRGPDDEGVYTCAGVGLGHRRLAIIDLSKNGHQPMTYGLSGVWLTYNGEIYNYEVLKKELEQKGYAFTTKSDTELLLAGYLAWGVDAFERFNGMWALALYDSTRKSLLLCRDRYGIKPLYYFHRGDRFAFASEYKALLAHTGLKIEADNRGVLTALDSPFALEASGFTMFRDVKNLLPGHYLKISDGKIAIKRWWDTSKHLQEAPYSIEEQAMVFQEKFFDSCRLRMRADVQVSTSLSGGLDSGSIVSSLHHLGYAGNATYVHGFRGYFLDETDIAIRLAQEKGVSCRVVEVADDEIVRDLDEIIYHFEGIYAGMPDAAYRIYRAQQQDGVKVSIDGHGADEMLAGYGWYLDEMMKDTGFCQPRTLFQLARMKMEIGNGGISGLLKATRLYGWLRDAYRTYRPFGQNTKFLNSDMRRGEEFYGPIPFESPAGWSRLKKKLYEDFHVMILPRILRNFDLMSMANGIEVRMPFMDYQLVNFVFSLPDQAIVGEGYTKFVLRHAMKGIVPDYIRMQKRKIGFNSPVAGWLLGPLKHWVEEILYNSTYEMDLIDKKMLVEFYRNKSVQGNFTWGEALNFWKYLNLLKLFRMLQERREQGA